MSRPARIILLTAVALLFVVLMFGQSINRFLFHPEGYSTAASSMCLTNESGAPVVARIEVDQGASSVTLLAPGEEACSASPEEGRPGRIIVAVSEEAEIRCVLEAKSGEHVSLALFDAPDNCEWTN